jgi:predicted membrane GTPase involved in stress response
MRRILEAICGARQDDLKVSVTGLDEFDIGDFAAELSDAETLLALGIDSPTMKRQIFQKLAFKYLCDVRQEVKDRIAQEIESQALMPTAAGDGKRG